MGNNKREKTELDVKDLAKSRIEGNTGNDTGKRNGKDDKETDGLSTKELEPLDCKGSKRAKDQSNDE